MDYKKFYQWEPPTIRGTVAYPCLEKSSLGQVSDKAIPGQQEFASPVTTQKETYKPPKSVVSLPMKTDPHIETAKHDLLSIHHEQAGNKAKASDHAAMADKLRRDPENPGKPTQAHYLTAAKMVGLRKSAALFIDLEKAAKRLGSMRSTAVSGGPGARVIPSTPKMKKETQLPPPVTMPMKETTISEGPGHRAYPSTPTPSPTPTGASTITPSKPSGEAVSKEPKEAKKPKERMKISGTPAYAEGGYIGGMLGGEATQPAGGTAPLTVGAQYLSSKLQGGGSTPGGRYFPRVSTTGSRVKTPT